MAETEARERYEHFSGSSQEALRLKDALDGFFSEEDPELYKNEYRRYLIRRIRPAALYLAGCQDGDRLKGLISEGLLPETVLSELLQHARDPQQPSVWLQLLRAREAARETAAKSGPGEAARENAAKSGPGEAARENAAKSGPGEAAGETAAKSRPENTAEAADAGSRPGLPAARPACQEWKAVLRQCRRDLYRVFPYLDGALAALSFAPGPEGEGLFGTDGQNLFFHPETVEKQWRQSPARVRRGWLHVLLHCLLGHLWLYDPADEEAMFACDVSVEFLIERECWREKKLRDVLGMLPQPGMWSGFYDRIAGGTRPVREIRKELKQSFRGRSLDQLKKLVTVDDPSFWRTAPGDDPSAQRTSPGDEPEKVKLLWSGIAAEAQSGGVNGRRGLGIGETTGGMSEQIAGLHRGKQDFREYLHQFAVPREEMELDTESFDYIYYSLGLERYKNLPLIEPLEYREGHKLEELVIAIDTSGSCKTDTVRRFLEEIYAILEEKENFFRRMNVWMIQCDCVLQDVQHIRCREDWDAYIRDLTVSGRAGTDFTPVFRYVDKLKKEGQLKNLKGLLYFTDGDGAYPRQEPPYETAFVFVKETAAMGLVPSWARILKAY